MHKEAVIERLWRYTWTSAKCNSVRKPYANLPGTPVALASACKYFQMLPAPLELCKALSDSATGSIYLGDPGGDRHLIIRNTGSIFPSSWSHALLPSFRRSTQFVWFIMAGYPFVSSHPLSTLLLEPLFLTNSLRIPCDIGGVLMMGCLPSSSTVSPHRDRVNLEMHSEAVIERIWRYTWRL